MLHKIHCNRVLRSLDGLKTLRTTESTRCCCYQRAIRLVIPCITVCTTQDAEVNNLVLEYFVSVMFKFSVLNNYKTIYVLNNKLYYCLH